MELKDWHLDTNLQKAKAIIQDKNNSFVEISNVTGISYNTLMKYRRDSSNLDNASGKIWNLLSQVYDWKYSK